MLVSDTYKKDEQQNESNPDTKENGQEPNILDIIQQQVTEHQEAIDLLQEQYRVIKEQVEGIDSKITRVMNSVDYIQEYFMKSNITDVQLRDIKNSLNEFIISQRRENKNLKNDINELKILKDDIDKMYWDIISLKENGIPLTNARIATNEENVNNNNIRLSDVLVNIEKINNEIKYIEQRMKEVN